MKDESQVWHKDLSAQKGDDIAATQQAPSYYKAYGKRLFDLVFVIMSAPFAFMIVAVAAIFVALDGKSPFFAHPRVGKNGKIFACWKLRTMVPDADAALAKLCANSNAFALEWQQNQKLENDPRVTKLGKLLRKTHLDELPQLWNVLIGDMSVVGPRPFTPEQIQLYSSAGAKSYFSMHPGLTGPWQISHRETESNKFLARVAFDEAYNRSESFSGDVVIVFQTILCVLKMRGQ